MRVRIKHVTRYLYPGPTSFGPHIVRLRPAEHARARLLSYNLALEPEKCEVRWQHDPWANKICRITYPAGLESDRLAFTVDAAFDIRPTNPFDFFVDDRCRELPFVYPDGLQEELKPFLSHAKPGPLLSKLIDDMPADGYIVDYLVAFNQRVAETVGYIIRNEPGVQTSEETLRLRRGSCRDSALLIVDAMRAQGLAARFVSGYLVQLMDEGTIPDLPRGMTRDVVDLHAWAEVYVPGGGWIGLDGTSGLLCGEGHIPLAATVNPELAAPISGTASNASNGFEFVMQIERLGHEPRPRKPYTDEAWQDMLRCGDFVDRELVNHNVALTTGGEPTWTSREHPEEPEWNTEALGPTKWSQGLRFAQQVAERIGTGVLTLQRMGKLYPGESLPRWALHLLWRRDGIPVWRDPALLSVGGTAPKMNMTLSDQLGLAKRFATRLAERLGVKPSLATGFEDPWIQIIEEQNLPEDVDPLKAELEDSEERRRLARLLGRGLSNAVGYALPIAKVGSVWMTSEWTFRRGHMFLLAGDSPMGLRLPLNRLGGVPLEMGDLDVTLLGGPIGWQPGHGSAMHRSEIAGLSTAAAPSETPTRRLSTRETPWSGSTTVLMPSPFGAAGPAGMQYRLEREGDPHGFQQLHWQYPHGPAEGDQTARHWDSEGRVVLRTALCVEPREDRLYVFLPPLVRTEDFLELVAAVEDTAAELGAPVGVEGYGPPTDPRLENCLITPDPGVIEVNLPVTHSFAEYSAVMELLHDAALYSGLTTEKYHLDGREAGSGGGNHLTLGGPATLHSPFLIRPDLLGSIIRFAQNHPSLSYLFTGLFVGPTSQAPRVDEARHDSLYELEVALAQIPVPGDGTQIFPWFVDRLLRNLLVDIAGNTHRTELCIDKLYTPAGYHGRLGIVEFRAFEMPPHTHMAAAQALLLRGLTAMFVAKPYDKPFIRWGSELHDRFMLPHYLWADICDVVRELREAGMPFDVEMFRPFLDYRFPIMGTHDVEDISLEVRLALEPWHVLGEETTGATVARYVDSSLERLQVRVDGAIGDRFKVTVNGFELPLRPTGRAAERIAGVRFRAWQPPHCLQPHIGVHHPLRFDVVDTWARRSLGACTYHVWHPEGRAFEHPPLTIFEAAARRAKRFTIEGHMPHPAIVLSTTPHPEQPFTLDLRRYVR